MGLIRPGEDGTTVAIDGPLPDGVLGEVRCHQQIYRRRPDVNGICRTFPRETMTLSTLPQNAARQARLRLLLRARAGAVGRPRRCCVRTRRRAGSPRRWAPGRAIVMRGNGAILTGETVEESIVMAFYLEEAARTELAVLAVGDAADLRGDPARGGRRRGPSPPAGSSSECGIT